MPTGSRGNTSSPLTPQQTLEKVTGLITEIGTDEPEAEAAPVAAEPEPTPPAPPPQNADPEPPTPEAPPDDQDAETVELDGEPITIGELKRRGLREADYTRKTQALAAERKTLRETVEAEVQASLNAERSQYQQGLQQLRGALEQLQGEPDWVTLRGELEPGEFLKRKADWEASKAQTERLRQHEAEIAQQAQTAAAQAHAKYLRAEQDKLLAAIPEWSDPDQAKAEQAKLVAHAKSYGFTEQEVRAVSDHRALLLLRDAMRYRELHRAPQPAKPKAAAIKTASPGTPERPRPNAKTEKLIEQAAKTHRGMDAMRAIESLLPD